MLLTKIKQYILQKYVFRKQLKAGSNCIVDRKSIFEGLNRIYNNTKIISSYVGEGTYIANNSTIKFTSIGKYCAIGDNVRTYLGNHPSSMFVSIHPAFYSIEKQAGFTFSKETIFEEIKYCDNEKKYVVKIGNDVWIGNNVVIMDGITIGDGAIIATGSIVTKNVEPYAVIGGIPGKVIKYRFNNEEVEFLLKYCWWDKGYTWLKYNSHYFKDIKLFMEKVYAKDK